MGMYISISRESGWGTSSGVFECIVESTREMFSKEEEGCAKLIYEALDERGFEGIMLDDVQDENCFNIFYQHCEAAMNNFPQSARGKIPPPNHIPGILWNWSEVLRLMREDSRFRPLEKFSNHS